MQYISEIEAENRFDDYLNDVNSSIQINNMTYAPAFVLYHCDKIAYDCLQADWLDSEDLTTDEDYKNEVA